MARAGFARANANLRCGLMLVYNRILADSVPGLAVSGACEICNPVYTAVRLNEGWAALGDFESLIFIIFVVEIRHCRLQ